MVLLFGTSTYGEKNAQVSYNAGSENDQDSKNVVPDKALYATNCETAPSQRI
jgi:hypothetical protein